MESFCPPVPVFCRRVPAWVTRAGLSLLDQCT